jgi:hypothetical protein
MSMQYEYVVDVRIEIRVCTASALKGSAVFGTAAIASWLVLPCVGQTFLSVVVRNLADRNVCPTRELRGLESDQHRDVQSVVSYR